MPRLARTAAPHFVLLSVLVVLCGCQNGPFATQQAASANANKSGGLFGQGSLFRPGGISATPDATQKTLIAQTDNIKSQSSQWERLNADITSQLADARKSLQLLTDRNTLLQEELSNNAIRLRDSELKRLDTEKRAQVLAASARSRPGATISTNTNARSTLRAIEIPGVEARQEGDLIRASIPADQLFSPGSDQFLPSAGRLLEDVARSLTQAYPRQLMSVEGFTDGVQGGGVATPHQLTAAQANAVLNELTTRYRMPAGQMMMVAHGANVPRGVSGTFSDRARSRRIEIVIYPETVN